MNDTRDTMVLMLPMTTDNGARLAAILPTALASLANGLGKDPAESLARSTSRAPNPQAIQKLPALRSALVIVVDGLGTANLRESAGHARTLRSLSYKRITTVIPSTTGAALTTLTTGALPGTHGLIGYRIRHPELGLLSTLKDWEDIQYPAKWQRSTPLFSHARELGARAVAIGRPAHASGGLTAAILAGAEYLSGQTIADRFALASQLLRGGEPVFAYLYVDELDKAAHAYGWQSSQWATRLEQFDLALEALLRSLPAGVGVVVTADHGIIDVPPEKRHLLEQRVDLSAVAAIGGEPRMRSLYLYDPGMAEELASQFARQFGKLAWVGTRDEAIAGGWFGSVAAGVAERLGEVLVVARGQHAFMSEREDPAVLRMVGQHGGVSDEERGVPIALGGALGGSGFTAAVTAVARAEGSVG